MLFTSRCRGLRLWKLPSRIIVAQPELLHQLLQRLRQPRQLFGGGGHLLRRTGRLLGQLVHVLDGFAHLLGVGGLLLSCRTDRLAHLADRFGRLSHLLDSVDLLLDVSDQSGHHFASFLSPGDDLIHGGKRRLGDLNTPIYVLAAFLDQILDLLGAGGASVGKLRHLVGHHREPPAVLPGPCSLDGGIQGQQVGLIGNVGDHVNDPGDLL